MFTYLIDDILIQIIDLLDYKDRDSLFCSGKFINNFMLNCYFKYKIAANNIPTSFYTLGYSNNLDILILFRDNKITDILLKYLCKLRHLELLLNKNITDDGLKYISDITYLKLGSNRKITDNGFWVHNVVVNSKCVLKMKTKFSLFSTD